MNNKLITLTTSLAKNKVIKKVTKKKFNWFNKAAVILTSFYIGVRHILPKEDYVVYREDGTGDKLIGHTSVNCILFDRVSTWWDCGSYTCTSNVYRWKRLNLIIK
jgi:hypothetical protein